MQVHCAGWCKRQYWSPKNFVLLRSTQYASFHQGRVQPTMDILSFNHHCSNNLKNQVFRLTFIFFHFFFFNITFSLVRVSSTISVCTRRYNHNFWPINIHTVYQYSIYHPLESNDSNTEPLMVIFEMLYSAYCRLRYFECHSVDFSVRWDTFKKGYWVVVDRTGP